MRIDYNEPKKSYTSPQPGGNRTRKESSNPLLLAVVVTGLISLAVGFCSGWMLSQRYAKKGFQAAMEQQSLENAPKAPPQPPAAPPQTAVQQAATAPPGQQQQQPGGTTQPPSPGGQPAPETPLSFYKTLPSGQKSNVLGSGINAADNSTAKQPLQAAIPKNYAKPAQPQVNANPVKATPPAAEKLGGKQQDATGFTVQVASYSLKSEADSLKSKLSSKGYSVHIDESNQGDKGTWYRVRVGKRLEQEAAKDLAAKLGRGAIPIPDKD